MKLLHQQVVDMYDKRAKNLRETLPLNLQINLSSSVSNRVLAVHSVDTCVQILWNIVLRTIEFDIEENDSYLLLR